MRIAWLIQGINANVDVYLRALAALGNEQLIAHQAHLPDTAFDTSHYFDYARTLAWSEPPAARELVEPVRSFRPDVGLMSSWGWPRSYRMAMRALEPHVLRVLVMDNTWHGTPRQWVGRLTRRFYITPLFDCVVVPSDRTEWFARRLGFRSGDVIRGLYTADTALFDSGSRAGDELADNRAFLFAGRLVPVKGIDVLAVAYRQYRERTADPWDLHVAGIGDGAALLDGITGVKLHGFLQPPALAELMRSCSCLLLPSRFEPYGIVVHEAAAAGLPLLVSDVAGAGPGLVQDGYNGWVLPHADPASWAQAMERVSASPPQRLQEMSEISQALSRRLSVPGWARNLDEELARRIPVKGRKRLPARRLSASR